MELIDQLKKDGIDKGLCRLWQGKLRKGLTTEQLVQLYFQGIDFCISEDYPTLDFLRTHFKGLCEPFGVFVDEDVAEHKIAQDTVLNGACRAMLAYDSYTVSRLYVRHTSTAGVAVADNAIVTIDLFNDAKLHLAATGNAKVLVNIYGDGPTVNFANDKEAKERTIVTYHNKTTY